MTAIDLDDLGYLNRYSDPSDRVALRVVSMDRPLTTSAVRQGFVGDDWPTQFMGEGKRLDMPMTVRFLPGEHVEYLALLDFLERAVAGPDPRVILRSYFGDIAGLDPAHVVTIPDWQRVATDGGLAWNVSWTAYRVQG